MDFSKMRMKLSEYETLEKFKEDFDLICQNAMTYSTVMNTADTVYYKNANMLLQFHFVREF